MSHQLMGASWKAGWSNTYTAALPRDSKRRKIAGCQKTNSDILKESSKKPLPRNMEIDGAGVVTVDPKVMKGQKKAGPHLLCCDMTDRNNLSTSRRGQDPRSQVSWEIGLGNGFPDRSPKA